MEINKNDLVIISEGAYSNYSILFSFRALLDFDTKEIVELYVKEYPEQAHDTYRFQLEDFTAWLLDHKYIEELETKEWLISEYGDLL